MELGVLLDLRNPDQWQRPWVEHYQRTLERVERIEAWGAGSVWLTEHHFFPDGYLPQPLVFAAAIAARTTRIRIGTAVVVAALRHPTHLAEEAAVVDILSGGRLELGLGAGWSSPSTRPSALTSTASSRSRLVRLSWPQTRRPTVDQALARS
ncbi:MAG: hypothetical protein QOE61_4660 [Micromonosporaceae bacterium]|nr:hypothetical protein [Micromonosporaceae bacterium]